MFAAYYCSSLSSNLKCFTLSPFNISCGSTGEILNSKDITALEEENNYFHLLDLQ